MRFDVNLSILFPDLPLLQRPAAAAALGFDAAELWWPFEGESPAAADVDRLVDAIGAADLRLVALNLTHGVWSAGEHGLTSTPGQQCRFRDSVEVAIAVAQRLGCGAFNALYGNLDGTVPADLLEATAVDNLAYAAARAATVGTSIVIESLNPVDFPLYGLHRTADALALADRVRADTGAEVKLLFDVYHVQRTEGDLITRIRAHASRFGHVQVADVPGRRRPGTGEISFERVLPALEGSGYAGFVGLEYRPSPSDLDTFSWLPIDCRPSRLAGGEHPPC